MKTNRFIAMLILIITVLVLSACRLPFVDVVRGSGDLVAETREVSGFNKVRLDGAGRLVITQGESESLEIEAEDNIINELTAEVRDQTLVLGFQDQPWKTTVIPTRGITYTLTVIDLTDITFNGAGDLEMQSLETSSLNLVINGAGQINLDELMADSLSVQISGTGTIDIGGQVSSHVVAIEGAGNYQAGDLQTSSTEVNINGWQWHRLGNKFPRYQH
ncbi:MAG: head GIN domain-containing protein [Brevefilum sp.]